MTVMTDFINLPRTERDCYVCEDGTFIRDGHELICDTCQHSPTFEASRSRDGPWEMHRRRIANEIDEGGRPRLVGGYEEAYWGTGPYEYDPSEGFLTP